MDRAKKISHIMGVAMGKKPYYTIEYTVSNGQITILSGEKDYPKSGNIPSLLYCPVSSKEDVEAMNSVSTKDIIETFEREGANHEEAERFKQQILLKTI